MRRDFRRLLGLWVSPLGAVTAVVCFFLPWVKFTCLGVRRSLTGAQLGGPFWVIPIAAAVIVVVFLFSRRRRQATILRLTAALGGVAALIAILIKYLEVMRDLKGVFSAQVAHDAGLRLQPGAVATVMGLALILVGIPFIRTPRVSPPSETEAEDRRLAKQPDLVA